MRTSRPAVSFRTSGFSLVELLVVVALIGFLTVGIGIALGGGNEGTRLRASEASLSGYLQLIRSKAILEGQSARLLIAADTADPATYYRKIGGVFRDSDNSNRWIAIDDGFMLSEGVYVWEANSSVGLNTMLLDYPKRQPVSEGTGSPWLYLEIGSIGELTEEAGSLILFADRPQPGDLPQASSESIAGGFLLSKLGVTIFPQDPSDLLSQP